MPGVSRDRPRLVYRVEKNLGQDPDWLDTHVGAVNIDPVRLRNRVRKPNTLMLRRLSLGKYREENRTKFTPAVFELHYDPLGWIVKVWNAGTVQLVEFRTEAGAKAYRQEAILQGKPAAPVSEPVPLDVHGRHIFDIAKPDELAPARLVQLEFEVQPRQRFTGVLPLT